MSTKHLLLGTLILGVVGNIFDMIFHGGILGSTYATISAMSEMANKGGMVWFIIADFVGAFLFTWFYSKVQVAFEKTSNGAMMYGLFLGIVLTIPGMLYESLMYNGFPYWLSWVWVIGGIIHYTIYGLILGMIVKPKKATA